MASMGFVKHTPMHNANITHPLAMNGSKGSKGPPGMMLGEQYIHLLKKADEETDAYHLAGPTYTGNASDEDTTINVIVGFTYPFVLGEGITDDYAVNVVDDSNLYAKSASYVKGNVYHKENPVFDEVPPVGYQDDSDEMIAYNKRKTDNSSKWIYKTDENANNMTKGILFLTVNSDSPNKLYLKSSNSKTKIVINVKYLRLRLLEEYT